MFCGVRLRAGFGLYHVQDPWHHMRAALLLSFVLGCFTALADTFSLDLANYSQAAAFDVTVYDAGGSSVGSAHLGSAVADSAGTIPSLASIELYGSPGPLLLQLVPYGSGQALRSPVQFTPGTRALYVMDWSGSGAATNYCGGVTVVGSSGVQLWGWFWAGWASLLPLISFRWVYRLVCRTTVADSAGEVLDP